MTAPVVTIAVTADLDGDGVLEADLTSDVNSLGGGFRISRDSDASGRPKISEMRIGLANDDGKFSPDYASSPYFGLLDQDETVRVTATHLSHAYTLGTGYAKEWKPVFRDVAANYCELTTRDLGAFLVEADPVNVSVMAADSSPYLTRTESTLIDAYLDALGLTAADRLLDAGLQTLPTSFGVGRVPMDGIMEAAASGIGGSVFIDARSRLRYHNRQFRTGVSRYRQEVKGLKPALYWRFGEQTGTTAADASGNGRTGTINGGATLAAAGALTADIDTAIDFDGVNDSVTRAHESWMNVTTAFTASLWFKADTLPGAGADMGLLDKGSVGPIQLRLHRTGVGEPDQLQGYIAIGGVYEPHVAWGTVPTTGTWYHAVLVYDGTNLLLYINGALVSSVGRTGTMDTNAGALTIGVGATNQWFDGKIDEVAVYTTALTAEDVWGLYTAGTGASWLWGDNTSVKPSRRDPNFSYAEYVTTCRARTTVFRTGQADTVVFKLSRGADTRDSMSLAAGEVFEREFNAEGAFAALTALTAITDYRANTAIRGNGTDKTSFLVVTVTDLGGGRFRLRMVNTDSALIYVTYFQIRGIPVQFYADRGESVYTLTVPGRKAGRAVELDLVFAGDTGAKSRDFAAQVCRTGRYVPRRISLDFPWVNDATCVAMLTAEVGDLVYYEDTALGARSTGLKDWFYISGVTHDVKVGADRGQRPPPVTTVQLVAADLYRNPDAVAWDSFQRDDAVSGLGTSDSGEAWQNSTNWNLNSHTARMNTNTATAAWMDVGAVDQDAEVSLSAFTGDADAEAGVVFRLSDASNYLRAYVSKATSKVHLEKVVAGVATALGTAVNWTPADAAEIRVLAQGNRLRVWVNQVRVFDVVDATFNQKTNAGIYGKNASGTVRFASQYAQGV